MIQLEPFTEITVYSNGYTEPVIPSGTSVILVQEGMVKVGSLFFIEDEEDALEIAHPINEEKLNREAYDLVKSRFPNLLNQEDATVLLCPNELSESFIWEQ